MQNTHISPKKKCQKHVTQINLSWICASEDSACGKNQKGESLWAHVHRLYHDSQAENPTEINNRNKESMKCPWKRLSENAKKKRMAVCREVNARMRSGMSDQDVEKEAQTIYEVGGNKFQDLIVYNEVMSKHPKWSVHDTTHVLPTNEDVTDEQGGAALRGQGFWQVFCPLQSRNSYIWIFNYFSPYG